MDVDCALVWLRRDLRLADNTALHAACAVARRVVPLFVVEPSLLAAAGGPRRWFLHGALSALEAELRGRGSALIVRGGSPEQIVPQLARQCGATAVFWNRDDTPHAQRRDAAVARQLAREGVAVETRKDRVLHEANETLTAKGTLARVFSAYQRSWESLTPAAPLPAPQLPPLGEAALASDGLAALAAAAEEGEALARWWQPSEAGGQAALRRFLGGSFARYARERDLPGSDATSRLSPHLHFGTLSPRTVLAAALRAGDTPDRRVSTALFTRELCFRDFYAAQLSSLPQLRRQPFRREFERVGLADGEGFAAWQAGRTGYPIVDAGMRQLLAEGWLHNRARMIVAAFLTKDLLIDYRRGERYFMERLIDGDIASNNAGWQWSAGTGIDAQPYFRVFNPVAQGERYDPDGLYVRRYVPELAGVPRKFVQRPWQMSAAQQRASGCRIGTDYPAPIVDHAEARARALAHYRAALGR